MRKYALLPLAAVILAGCSRADVETLGRIGQRVAERTDALLNAEPNKSMIRTLPMLQAPKPAEMKDAAEPKQLPPRLSVE
jgi:hypothetical protein